MVRLARLFSSMHFRCLASRHVCCLLRVHCSCSFAPNWGLQGQRKGHSVFQGSRFIKWLWCTPWWHGRYVVPPAHRLRFERLAQSLAPNQFKACSQFLRHKVHHGRAP